MTYGLAASEAGQLVEGNEYLRRGYALSLHENGDTHPRTLEMRAYLCKGLMDYGDLEGALVECDEARKKVEGVAADSTAVVGTIRFYEGEVLRLMGRYEEAKKQFELAKVIAPATKVDEILTELAHVADSMGSNDALPFFKRSLEQATKDLPPLHPNVLLSELDLANAELQRGLVADARALLDRAMDALPHAELPPLNRADLQFAAARALWRSAGAPGRPAARPAPSGATDADADAMRAQAEALAREARASYRKNAPPTKRYQDALSRIDAWLASSDVRSLPLAPSRAGKPPEPW